MTRASDDRALKRLRTIRGTITLGQQTLYNVGQPIAEPIRIILNNGDITRNFRIVSFKIFPNMHWRSSNVGLWNTGVGNNITTCLTLCLNEENARYWGEFERIGQIGWAVAHGQDRPREHFAHLDMNHVIVEDLFIGFYASDFGSGGHQVLNVDINYEIVIEAVDSDRHTGLLNLMREKQNR